MIDAAHDLPVARQAEVLDLSRSSVYYRPRPVSPEDLALMRRIDELHLERPFAGSRMLRDFLEHEGVAVGRRHVATLMKRMGIEAIYRRRNSSKPAPGHKIYPYLLRGVKVERPNRVLGDGHHLYPDGARLRLSRRRRRLVHSARALPSRVDHDGYDLLRRSPRSLSEKWRILVAAFARIGFCLLMSKTFRPWTIDQPLLLPPSVQDFVGEDHLARFILALVLEHLDLGEIESAYASERGQPAFDPAMMTALLLYGYCHGVYSSRRIAKATRERVDFMSIVGLDPPDFRTVSDFRKRHLKALAGLFGQVLKLCEQAGFVKLGHVALDGTKIKANASKHKAMSYERMEKRAAELEAEVERWLSAAEAADAEEDRAFGRDKSGEELPKWVADKKKRAEKIRAAKAELEAEAKAAAAAKAKAQAEAEERRQAEGRKKPGKPAAPPSEEPDPKAQKNFTDPESRIMKTKDGFIQGYNAQAAVDATAQVIVAHGLDAKQSDQHQLAPIADAIEANLGKKPTQLSADAGYCSDANLAAMEEREIDAYIAPGRAKHAGEGEGGGARVAAMRERIKAGGRSSPYRLRKQLPEPVFGQIKQARGFRQFLLRGVEKVANEWGLVCLAHNILKLAQGRTPSLAALATG